MDKDNKKRRPFDVTIKIYKIVSICLYVIWTFIMLYVLIDETIKKNNGGSQAGWALVFALIIIVIGFIGYCIMTVIGIGGLSMSIANKENPKRKANIIFFSIETLVAVSTYFSIVLIGSKI